MCLIISPSFGQKQKKQKKGMPAVTEVAPKPEKKEKEKEPKIKKFEDLVTEEATTDEGLFHVHKVSDKYYFEIPDEILEREILIVSRISGHVKGLNFGGAGMKSRPQQVIRWQRHENKLLLRSVSFNNVASFDDPIYQSVKNNNFEPIIKSFEIKAYNKDTTGVLIEMNSMFTEDMEMIGALSKAQRKEFEINGIDKSRNIISWMKSFPENVEVRHVLTYKGKKLPDNQVTGTLSIEMNQSFILLPEDPWQTRLYDARVGYFSINQTNYSLDEQKAAKHRYITRWRLDPKDMDAYKRGELVEPKKPIVYYIDPATPVKWRKYIKQGVDDWQGAFEAAGFKNAIMAIDPPTPQEDPEWSPEDVRYSVIRYITTEIQNAQGPHVHDPRTGEILESDILWYHNVMNLLRNWFFIQTSAINPEARGVKFKEDVMGQLIRFVAAHEVGHTLGLPHNMGSSVAYPVDSLRSPTFTSTHGTAPSIMDYARFNYIAQPEDGVTNFYPGIGEYDIWSIIYGYRLIPDVTDPEEQHKIMHDWILDKADNPAYRFGRQRFNTADPSSQTEDLGDDGVYASELGIKNLQRIVPELIKWTEERAEDFDDLDELYNQVIGQLRRYVGHVATNVGGVYERFKTFDQDEPVYTPVEKEKQKRAVQFMNDQIFDTPDWLIDQTILSRIEQSGTIDRIRGLQSTTLNRLFNKDRLHRLMEGEALHGDEAYTLKEMFNDVEKGIFSELQSKAEIDPFRRNLQRVFISQMADLMNLEEDKYDQSDIKAYARASLMKIEKDIRTALADSKISEENKIHLIDALERAREALDQKKEGKNKT